MQPKAPLDGGADAPCEELSLSIADGDDLTDQLVQKVSLWPWILHEQTLLSLCFRKEGVTMEPTCCCCVSTRCCVQIDPATTIRQRIFAFCLIFALNMAITLQATLARRGEAWAAHMILFVLMPLTCLIKMFIAKLAAGLRRCHPSLPMATAIVVLVAVLLLNFMELTKLADAQKALTGILRNILNFGGRMLVEFLFIVFKYVVYSLCCTRCLPDEDAVRRFSEVKGQIRGAKAEEAHWTQTLSPFAASQTTSTESHASALAQAQMLQ